MVEFRDGRSVAHTDSFDLYQRTSKALGPKGVLLGWLSPVQAALRRTARKGLDDWRAPSRTGVR
jgi:hypothetical protein